MRRRHGTPSWAAVGLILSWSAASGAQPEAESPPPEPDSTASVTSGPELAFRTGYTTGTGTIDETPLSNDIRAVIPLLFDFGYRVNEQWFIGAYAQYGFGLRGATANATCSGCVSSLSRYGLQVQYHLPRPRSLWAGLGIGRQTLNTNLDDDQERSRSHQGWELLQLQLGADIPIAEGLALGPFVSCSLSTFEHRTERCDNQQLCPRDEQEVTWNTRSWPIVWATFGVRVVLLP